jgi:hypothetical protein
MGDIVGFPGFDERVWRRLEGDGFELLLGVGFPEASATLILADWKTRVMAAVRSFDLPVRRSGASVTPEVCEHLDAILSATELQVQRLTENLVAQLFVTVCELWVVRLGGSATQSQLKDRILAVVNSSYLSWSA